MKVVDKGKTHRKNLQTAVLKNTESFNIILIMIALDDHNIVNKVDNRFRLWNSPPSVECQAGQYKNWTMISCSKCPDGTEANVIKTGCGLLSLNLTLTVNNQISLGFSFNEKFLEHPIQRILLVNFYYFIHYTCFGWPGYTNQLQINYVQNCINFHLLVRQSFLSLTFSPSSWMSCRSI